MAALIVRLLMFALGGAVAIGLHSYLKVRLGWSIAAGALVYAVADLLLETALFGQIG